MAGVKGKSGRRSNFDEEQKLRVLRKAWNIIEKQLDDPNLDDAVKRDIASKLVVRNIPQELNAKVEAQVTEMPTIQKVISDEANQTPVNRMAEFDIGSPDPTEIP